MSDQNIINLELLKQYAGPNSVDFFLNLLAQELPQIKTEIQQAFKTHNLTEMSNQLHKLQGTCAYCGLVKLKETILTLSQIIKKEQKIPIEHYQNLTHAIEEVENLIPKLRAEAA